MWLLVLHVIAADHDIKCSPQTLTLENRLDVDAALRRSHRRRKPLLANFPDRRRHALEHNRRFDHHIVSAAMKLLDKFSLQILVGIPGKPRKRLAESQADGGVYFFAARRSRANGRERRVYAIENPIRGIRE